MEREELIEIDFIRKEKYQDELKEIERIGEMFNRTASEEAKKTYDKYVELTVNLKVERKNNRNYLFDYWENLKR